MDGSGAMRQDAEFWTRARCHLIRYLTFRTLCRGSKPFFEARQGQTQAKKLGLATNLLCK